MLGRAATGFGPSVALRVGSGGNYQGPLGLSIGDLTANGRPDLVAKPGCSDSIGLS